MPIIDNVQHQFEVNPLACGQAVISMVSGTDINEVFSLVGKTNETTLKDMIFAFSSLDILMSNERKQATKKQDLPLVALLSLETPKCWHWSLYFYGKFYDPEYGVLEDFPPSNRKYFWELKNR